MKNSRHFGFLFYTASIFILGFLIYGHTFGADFQMDSVRWIRDYETIRNLSNLQRIWEEGGDRFLTYLSFALHYRLHGLDPRGYHVINLILHCFNALLVYRWVCWILRTPILARFDSTIPPSWTAAFCGLLFLVHPLQTQAVTYVVQRATVLATAFYLTAVICYLKGRLEGKRRWMVLAWGTAFVSLFTKPIVLTIPLSVLACEVLLLRNGAIRKGRFLWTLPFWLMPLLFICFLAPGRARGWNIMETLLFQEPGAPARWQYLLTQFLVIRTYLRLFFVPVGQNLLWDYPLVNSFFEIRAWVALFSLVVLILWALWLYRRDPAVTFGVTWFFITLSVESSFFPLRDIIFEHRLYLPMIGFVLVVMRLLPRLVPSPQVIKGLVIFVLVLLSVLTFCRNALWADGIRLWQDTVQKSPASARAYHNLGLAYLGRGLYEPAIIAFEKALELRPGYPESLHNLAEAYEWKGRLDRAMDLYSKVLERNPELAEPKLGICRIYMRRRAWDKALDFCEQALANTPFYVEAHLMAGKILSKMKDWEGAILHYQRVLEIDPRNIAAQNGLGFVYGELRRIPQAIQHYEKALRLGSKSARTLSNLAYLYSEVGRWEDALKYATQALEKNPTDAQAFNNLGVAYARAGRYLEAIQSLRDAVRYAPEYAEAYTNLGAAYGALGDYEREMAYYRKALKLRPNDTRIYYNLAFSYEQQGRLALAVTYYRKTLKLNPSHVGAKQGLLRLRKTENAFV